jgi:hypothetical protein
LKFVSADINGNAVRIDNVDNGLQPFALTRASLDGYTQWNSLSLQGDSMCHYGAQVRDGEMGGTRSKHKGGEE